MIKLSKSPYGVAHRLIVVAIFFIVSAVTASLYADFSSKSAGDITRENEYLQSFDVVIDVLADASVRVHEKIVYVNRNQTNKHGINWRIPTRYTGGFTTGLVVEKVVCNGSPVHYEQWSTKNGIQLRIGDPERTLSSGSYTYEVTHHSFMQIGHIEEEVPVESATEITEGGVKDPSALEKKDAKKAAAPIQKRRYEQLYWNAIGVGNQLPVIESSVVVHLPKAVPKESIQAEAYTGKLGSKHQESSVSIDDGVVRIQSTVPLQPKEGLTVVVAFPWGTVHHATWWEKIWWFATHNIPILLIILAVLFSIGWYIYAYRAVRKSENVGTIIPLFYPPKGVSAAGARYIVKCQHDARQFAAEIIDMAIKGLVTISTETGWFGVRQYVLTKNPDAVIERAEPLHKTLFGLLFAEGDRITMDKSEAEAIRKIHTVHRNSTERTYGKYLQSNAHYSVVPAIFMGSVASLLFFFVAFDTFILMVMFFIFIVVGGTFLLRGRTYEGAHLHNDIKGFLMFLRATETERFNVMGTPPDRTPELYEKYLPYAVALDAEKQWTRQFASVFAALAAAQTPYTPLWIVGGDFRGFDAGSFATQFSNTITSATIPAATGGRGRVGGGRGGSGVGSW